MGDAMEAAGRRSEPDTQGAEAAAKGQARAPTHPHLPAPPRPPGPPRPPRPPSASSRSRAARRAPGCRTQLAVRSAPRLLHQIETKCPSRHGPARPGPPSAPDRVPPLSVHPAPWPWPWHAARSDAVRVRAVLPSSCARARCIMSGAARGKTMATRPACRAPHRAPRTAHRRWRHHMPAVAPPATLPRRRCRCRRRPAAGRRVSAGRALRLFSSLPTPHTAHPRPHPARTPTHALPHTAQRAAPTARPRQASPRDARLSFFSLTAQDPLERGPWSVAAGRGRVPHAARDRGDTGRWDALCARGPHRTPQLDARARPAGPCG